MSWEESFRKHGFKVVKNWMRYDNTELLFLRHADTKRMFQIRYPNIAISFRDFGFNAKGRYPRLEMVYKEININNFIQQLEQHKRKNPDFCLEHFIENDLVIPTAR